MAEAAQGVAAPRGRRREGDLPETGLGSSAALGKEVECVGGHWASCQQGRELGVGAAMPGPPQDPQGQKPTGCVQLKGLQPQTPNVGLGRHQGGLQGPWASGVGTQLGGGGQPRASLGSNRAQHPSLGPGMQVAPLPPGGSRHGPLRRQPATEAVTGRGHLWS